MNRKNASKVCHFVSTLWFILSASYIFVLALLQAGKSWWVIVSLSGYSVLMAFLLISLYLFAIFGGFARSQKTQIEHPLTTSVYYSFFYDVSPFLGALSGVLGAIGVSRPAHYLLVIATGSLWMTFLVWIIIDPIAGLLEMLLPSSRRHRWKRLAEAKVMHEKERLSKQHLLAEVEANERIDRQRWNNLLLPYAEKLAVLVVNGNVAAGDSDGRETEVVDMGVSAWQMGGLNCMRQLRSMAMEICEQKYQSVKLIDYISIWWDGIGSWKSHWLDGESELVAEGRKKPYAERSLKCSNYC